MFLSPWFFICLFSPPFSCAGLLDLFLPLSHQLSCEMQFNRVKQDYIKHLLYEATVF